MNKELDLPFLPQRIAIISSKNAAGYTDFMNHLTGNSFGYVYHTALIESVMQGPETEQGIINALDKIAENSHLFDLVVIIRGGGSQVDLSWFDSYNIAYHVTQFPLPVVTGIGHDKDMSVTDLVANRALKTPTAVADFIVGCTAVVENHLFEMWSGIKDISRTIIDKNRNRIESSRIRLLPLSRIMISDIKDKLSEKIIEIINIGKESTFRAGLVPANQLSRLMSEIKSFRHKRESGLERTSNNLKSITLSSLEKNRARVEVMKNSLNILKPENVLRRGYTLTSFNGRILKKSALLMKNDIIDTQFSDGTVSSKVLNKIG